MLSSLDMKRNDIFRMRLTRDADGYFYIAGDSTLWVCDPAGNLVFQKELSSGVGYDTGGITAMTNAQDGTVWLQRWRTGLCPINRVERTVGDALAVPAGIEPSGYFFGDGYDVYCYNAIGIYGISLETDTATLLMDFLNSDVSDVVREVVYIDEERFLIGYVGDTGSSTLEYGIFTRVGDVRLSDIPVLQVVGCGISADIMAEIVRFNREQNEVRVTVHDYNQYNNAENPYGGVDYHALSPDALSYLEQAGACFGTPIERLIHMNQPAYELYLDKGVDLKSERLEISLCAQHCNGGAAVDAWWQTTLKGLFVAGEAAGTHGVYRPGGSALNAGQVGALRAANYIARYPRPFDGSFRSVAKEAYQKHSKLLETVLSGENSNVARFSDTLRNTMSRIAGAVRDPEAITVEWSGTRNMLQDFAYLVHIRTPEEVPSLYKLKDNLACRLAVLTAMRDFYQKTEGKTRGSALYQNPAGNAPCGLADMAFIGGAGLTDEIQMVKLDGTVQWRPVRPIPAGGGFFENVWKTYRENGGVY